MPGRRTRGPLGLACLAALTLLAPASARAWPHYADGSADPVPNATTYKCLTCHTGQYGGYPTGHASFRLNPFGRHFGGYDALPGHTAGSWDAALRNADSDGDGFTNAQEVDNNRLPGFDKSGTSYVFTCYSAAVASHGHPASAFGNYVTTTHASALATPCAPSGGAHNDRPQFDLNDCTLGLDNCDNSPAATCTNVVQPRSEGASYTCTCPAGYAGSGSPSGVTCSDINECMTSPGRCGMGTCVNAVPGFTCNCSPGFVFDGTTCVVTNACLANTDDCVGANATCTPTGSGSTWTCGCVPGYTGAYAPAWTCTDVNECASVASCAVSRACVNTPGSFTCTVCGANTVVVGPSANESCACASGYAGDPLEGCEDVDECAAGTFACGPNRRCENTLGGYVCPCADGFALEGSSCVDVDECALGLDDCSENATCANVPGGFTCACTSFFVGDGVVCADRDECTTGAATCGVGEQCANVYGAPPVCVCAPGFVRPSADAPCTTGCGNGARALGEACDDGNTAAGDGCSSACAVEAGYVCHEPGGGASVCSFTCGDGLIDPPAEECDDGAANADDVPGACRTTCRFAYCGDGRLDPGELCDPGDGVTHTPALCAEDSCVVRDAGVDGGGQASVGCAAAGDARTSLGILALALVWVARRRGSR